MGWLSSHFGVEQFHRFNFQAWKQEDRWAQTIDRLRRSDIQIDPLPGGHPSQYRMRVPGLARPLSLDVIPSFSTASLARSQPGDSLIRLNEAARASPVLCEEVIHQELDHFMARSFALPEGTVCGFRHTILELASMLNSFERIRDCTGEDRETLFETLDRYEHVGKDGQVCPALDTHRFGSLIRSSLESGPSTGLLQRLAEYIQSASIIYPTCSSLLAAMEEATPGGLDRAAGIEREVGAPNREDLFLALGRYLETGNRRELAIASFRLALDNRSASVDARAAYCRALHREVLERGTDHVRGMLSPGAWSPLIDELLGSQDLLETDMEVLRRLARADAVQLGDRRRIREFLKARDAASSRNGSHTG